MQHIISIDLDQTKAYPILHSFTYPHASFLFDAVQVDDKMLFNKHVYNVKEIIENRKPTGANPDNINFFKVQVELMGRVEKTKQGETILVPLG